MTEEELEEYIAFATDIAIEDMRNEIKTKLACCKDEEEEFCIPPEDFEI